MSVALPQEDGAGSSLRQRSVSGLAWTSSARAGQQLMQFAFTVLLARLLAPEAFGIVGMIVVFTGFAALFAEFGFGSALVQKRDTDAVHWDSVFWLTLVVGAALTLTFALAAPLIAAFYRSPVVAPLTRVLALNFLILAPSIVPLALLQRRMDFRSLGKQELIAAAGAGVAAVAAALQGLGLWSLAVHSLLLSTFTAALAWRYAGWKPRLRFSAAAIRELLGFSANLFGFTFVNYWARNADRLLIGRLLGAAPLGLYTRAYSLMLLPITQIIGVVTQVMFPALSSIQHDRPRVRAIYLRAMSALALITFPLFLGLAVVADDFIAVLLGPAWAGVVPVLRVLCLVGMLQTLSSPTGWIYTSQGRTDWMMWWGVFGSGALIVALVVGVMLGSVQSVAWAYFVGNIVILYPCIRIPGSLIGLRFGDVVARVAGAFACAATMATVVWLCGGPLAGWPAGFRLAAQVTLGVAAYAALVLAFQPAGIREVRDLIPARADLRGGYAHVEPESSRTSHGRTGVLHGSGTS